MEKKKILFVNDIAYGGGTEAVMQNITANLSRDRYEITVLTLYRQENFYKWYKSDVRYWYLYKDNMFGAASFGGKLINRLRRGLREAYIWLRIRTAGFDTAASIKEGHSMKYVAKLPIKRKAGWVHIDYSVLHWTEGCFDEGGELQCMKKFDNIICVSKIVMESVIKYVGYLDNIKVVENPIDEKLIVQKSLEEQNEAVRTEGRTLFVTVGRLCRQKGYDMLLDACESLNKAGYKSSYEVWIVGGGECETALKAQSVSLGTDNVKFLGHQDNPYCFIREADWFISSSRFEGYAIAPQEAAILGIPVIATDCSGVRELLGDNEYGIITDSSAASIGHAMEDVLNRPYQHEHYRQAIIKRAGSISLTARMAAIEEIL